MFLYTRLINSQFNSNTYILHRKDESSVWLIDPGDVQQIFDWMISRNKNNVVGVLLTHTHFDHFYGAEAILRRFACPLYVANEYGRNGLFDSKQNGSKYTGMGFVSVPEDTSIKYYSDTIQLWMDESLKVLYTPGHSDDSVCLLGKTILFTGDTLIKDFRTVTKLKGGSVEKLDESVKIISTLKGNNLKVLPGHGDEFELDEYDLNVMNTNPLNNLKVCRQ